MKDDNSTEESLVIMSKRVPSQEGVYKTTLNIPDEDTCFDVYCGIFKGRKHKYLYIKLEENSAVAPFYYNKSFTIEDLQEIDEAFKANEDMEIALKRIEGVFKHNKVKINYINNKEAIKMELKISIFEDVHIASFELIKEMIPEKEKDDMLLTLYHINKDQLNKGKEIINILEKYKEKITNPELIEYLQELKSYFEVDDYDEEEVLKQIVTSPCKPIKFVKREKAYVMELKNKTRKPWPQGFIEFKTAKNSEIVCQKIKYPEYDTPVGETSDYIFHFDKNLKPGDEYNLVLDIFIGGKQLEDVQCIQKVKIKKIEADK